MAVKYYVDGGGNYIGAFDGAHGIDVSGYTEVPSAPIHALDTWNGASWDLYTDDPDDHALPINRGGTGRSVQNDALNALLPDQAGNATKSLKTDATDAVWEEVTAGSSEFEDLNSGTNTSAAMVVGTGASLSVTGSGTISATSSDTVTGLSVTGGKTLTVTDNASISGGAHSGTNTGDQTTVSGNAGTATALATPRNINGVAFDGTGNITVTAAAGTLSGTTLAAGVTASSLTSFGAGIALGTPASGVATNLTGTASGLTAGAATILATARAIYGNDFNGSAALAQIIAPTFGGTGNGFTKFTGPTTSEKTFTLPNATSTILTTNAAVTVPQGGTGLATLTDKNVIIGAGTGNVTFVAPGTSGNVLKSDGTNWTSGVAPTAGWTLIASTTPGAVPTVTFSSIPTTYTDLKLVWTAVSCGTATRYQIHTVTKASNGEGLAQLTGMSVINTTYGIPLNIGFNLAAIAQTAAQTCQGAITILGNNTTNPIVIASQTSTAGATANYIALTVASQVTAGNIMDTWVTGWNGSGNYDAGTVALYGR